MNEIMHATTILCVRHNGYTTIGGDGQISHGNTVFKNNVKKIRALNNGKVYAGFAGVTCDAIGILNSLESYLQHYNELEKACVEMIREWRSGMSRGKTDAMLIVCDKNDILLLSGSGDIIRCDDGVVGIGSGGQYALSAAKALMKHTSLSAEEIVTQSLLIASEICVFSNDNLTIHSL